MVPWPPKYDNFWTLQRYNDLNIIFSRHNESFDKSNINNEETSYGDVGVAEDSLQAIDISNGDLNPVTWKTTNIN